LLERCQMEGGRKIISIFFASSKNEVPWRGPPFFFGGKKRMSFSILLPGRSPGGDLHSFSEAKKGCRFQYCSQVGPLAGTISILFRRQKKGCRFQYCSQVGRQSGTISILFRRQKKDVVFNIAPRLVASQGPSPFFFGGKKKRAVFVTSRIIVTRYCLYHFVPVNIDIPRRGMGYLRGQNKSFI
jgi:hypothetical protein